MTSTVSDLKSDENQDGIPASVKNKTNKLSGYTMVYFDLETTGLGKFSEICQIGACFLDKEFSRYVCPVGEIEESASEVTGFTKESGLLLLCGRQVETVSLSEAWRQFLEFLKSTNNCVVLLAHNRSFDSRFLLRDLTILRLINEFNEVCAGIIDTLPLSREIFPKRRENGKTYKLVDLVQDIIGEQHVVGSHDALVDAKNLQKLMQQVKVELDLFEKHFMSISDLVRAQTVRRKAKFIRYKIPNVSLDMAKRIAQADISYEDLKRAYKEEGERGIWMLICPRVTGNRGTIESITQALSGLKL